MDKLKQWARLLRLYARMDLRWLMQDTKACLIVVFSEWIGGLAGISGVFLLSVRFGGIGGFSQDEMLFLLALSMLGEGFLAMCFMGFNCGHISRRLGRGQLDHMLIQPVPLWMQLTTESFLPFTGSSTLLGGLVLLWVTLSRLQLALSPGWWLLLLGFLLVRAALTLSLSYLAGMTAIWQPVASEESSSVAIDLCNTLCRYPLIGIPEGLMLLLETILPIALMAYMPALVLLGKSPSSLGALWPFALAISFSFLTILIFKKGVKAYAKFGSKRYRSMGMRN